MRWIFHIAREAPSGDVYAPPSLASEGFVHASFRDDVRESARVHFAGARDLIVLQIDPRRLDARVEIARTPRGPMPHVHGPIPRDAIRAVIPLDEIDHAPDGLE